MIKLELIKFADFFHYNDEIIDEILRQNPNIKPPIPIECIAEQAGINNISYKSFDRLEGALIANEYKTNGTILINNKIVNTGRQRFTLSHELGHFMIPKHGHNMQCSINDMNTQNKVIELEANKFAAELLMPKKIFCNGSLFDVASIENIIKLSETYQVSFESCANKYISTHHEPLAVLFYKDKELRYYIKNNNIPFYFNSLIKKGALMPDASLSYSDNITDNPIDIDSIDSSIWFDDIQGFILPDEIIEESYTQNSGYSTTLLNFNDEIEEVEY